MQDLIKRIEELERRLSALEGNEEGELSPTHADKFLGVTNGTCAAAIRRGELRAYTKPGGKRYRIALRDLKAWKETWQAGTGTA